MGRVTLLLLGGAELLVDRAPTTVDTRKAIALVAYLAVERTAARDTLATLLWPESDESRARSALRRTLSAVRSSLGEDAVVADRRTIELSTDISSDLGDFRAAVAETGGHRHDELDVCSDCLPLLERAADLYRGDFLAGFSVRGAAEFEDWARTCAEGLRLEMARVLERLAAGRAAIGDYPGAVEAASRWISLDPLHEPAYRNLMLLSAWAGDRAGAIEAYRRCVTVLDEELGVAPLEETTEFYEAILDEDLPPAPSVRRRVESQAQTTDGPAEAALIGRNVEMETLERELMWAATGGRVVIVSGDAWMGKTRVLEDFTKGALERGHHVLLSRGYRAERGLPFGAVAQLLRAADAAGWLDREQLPQWAMVEAGRLLPELGDAEPPEGMGETRFFDAIATLLLSLAHRKSLVIAIDDGQWLDAASASLLSYLTHRSSEAGLLLLVALRTGDLMSADVSTDVRSLGSDPVEIALEPLTSADILDLVPDRADADRITASTGGVPMLVAQYLTGAEEVELTTGMRRYIDGRLEAVAGLAAQILSAAAVLNGTCDVSLLRATSGRSDVEVVEAVEELLNMRILRDVPGSDGLGFTLDAMEQVAYEGMSPVRRRLLHGRAAASIGELPGADRDARMAATVALHLESSGQETEAAEWYARAGDLAAGVYAQAEAETAYRSALALGHDASGALHYALGEVLMLAGRYQEALDVFQASAAVADDELTASAEHRIGEVHRRLGHFDLAEHHFELAEQSHPEPAALYADWALLQHRRGDTDRAIVLARTAVKLAEDAGEAAAEARARDILGIVADDVTQLERALELAGEEPVLRMAALNSLAYAFAGDDDVDGAVGLVEEGITLARDIGDRHREAALLNHLADLHHRAGNTAESRAAQTEAVRLFAGIQPDSWEPEVWLLTRW